MLPTLRDNRKQSRLNQIFKKGFPGGSPGSDFNPGDLGALTNWFKPETLVFTNPPTNNTIAWDDSIQTGEKYTGTFIESVPTRIITLLNGHNVLICTTSTINEFVSYTTRTKLQKTKFTYGMIVKLDSSSGSIWNNAFRCSGLGGCNGFIGIGGDGTGKLRILSRSNNNQSSIADSVTTFNGNGWKVIIVQVDQSTGLCRLVEGGNDIVTTNALQDGITWTALSVQALLSHALSTPGGWWIGGLGEMFYYSDLKSDADINKLGNYLADKYALTWVDI